MKKESIIFLVFLVGIIIYMNISHENSPEPEAAIMINVMGRVNNPQVIETKKSITVKEAIDDCGGFTEDALTSAINLNEVITSNKVIEVPEKPKEASIIASIYGAVEKPGIYEIVKGARVYDLIALAGGLTKAANRDLDYAKIVKDEDAIYIEENSDLKPEKEYIKVYIDGEILNPGIYKLPKGAILNDLIKAAGGVNELADNNLNYAKELVDHSRIHIDKANITVEQKHININEASIELLKTLKSIGDKKAKLIYEYAKENRFDSEQEIIDLLGEYVYEQIKDDITF